MKRHSRISQQRIVLKLNGAIYTNLTLLLMSVTFIAIAPLARQAISLHELVTIKNKQCTMVPVVISIKKNGVYHLNTEMGPLETMPLESIKKILHKHLKLIDPHTISFCIKADPSVSYSQVAKIINWVETLGITHIGLLKTDES